MRALLQRLLRRPDPASAGQQRRSGRRPSWKRRVNIMRQHTWLIVLAAALLCCGIGGVAYHIATMPEHLRIAVGPPNSEDTRVVQAIAAQFGRERSNIRLNITVLPGGTREAAAAIDSNKADLAVIRRDTGMPRDGQVVAILRKNVVAFIVPSEPDPAKPVAQPARRAKGKPAPKPAAEKKPVEKISDLVGKRLGVVGRSANNIDLLKAILRQYNIPSDKVAMLSTDDLAKPNAPDKISIVQYDPSNVATAIRESNVDAIMSVGPVSSLITADAIAAATRGKEQPTFLAIGAAEAIAERNPVYESTEIKAGAFGGSPPRPEESVETIGVNHYIVARRQLGEQTAADFTKHLFDIRQGLSAELPSAAKIEAPDTDKDAAVPVHPGAAAYIDGELKTFFDRYGDVLFWGLMLVSFLGSGITGLLSYTRADDRVRRLGALEKLLDIAKNARAAAAMPVIDGLQSELDAIQHQMIRDVEAKTLDETAMMAFTLSFEQARIAIADRRAALADQPRPPLQAVASL
jgi:TRAP-type uncharacterized transport system substrate-binding protein